jgi:hypothetical protein
MQIESHNKGEFAFPQARFHTWQDKQPGMTLRDYFAGQALAGMLAHQAAFDHPDKAGIWAYEFSDAMLSARSK